LCRVEETLGFLRRQVFDALVILHWHLDLEGKGRASVRLVAEVDNAAHQLKNVPDRGRLAVLKECQSKFFNLLRFDFADSQFVENRA
jgi:very-short-patch-repair endonuclease